MIENFILHGFDSSHETNVITITGKLQDTFAVFHVRDNGFGITKEDLHTLRQSFTEKSLDHIERIGLKKYLSESTAFIWTRKQFRGFIDPRGRHGNHIYISSKSFSELAGRNCYATCNSYRR